MVKGGGRRNVILVRLDSSILGMVASVEEEFQSH